MSLRAPGKLDDAGGIRGLHQPRRARPFRLRTAYRNPALIAKMAETVDEISSGRVILGIGSGWAEPEYKAFGFRSITAPAGSRKR